MYNTYICTCMYVLENVKSLLGWMSECHVCMNVLTCSWNYLCFSKLSNWKDPFSKCFFCQYLPNDPTGELKNLLAFIEENGDIFKWIGLSLVAIQVIISLSNFL